MQTARIFFYAALTLAIGGTAAQSLFSRFAENLQPIIGATDTPEILPEYDFIVVGSGSGGSVLANRLSAGNKWRVLLLEAGVEENALSDIPLTAASTFLTRYNWGYRTERTPNACLGLRDQRCNWPKGRALGGTSVVNFMLYQRGHRRDFDEWAEMGAHGWSYAEVLPYFRRSESAQLRGEPVDAGYRGSEGPLSVQHAPYASELLPAFLRAGQELGYNVTDPNGASLLGFSRVQATLRNGRRCSAAKAYLRPILGRSNLHISMRSWVTRVLIDTASREATGVEFVKNKRTYRVRARREVLLAAGTIGSAQLLMLSGIGPREHLDEMNITTVADMPVGFNLQDHTGVSGLVFPVNRSVTIIETEVQTPANVLRYLGSSEGPFTLPGGAEGIAFMKLANSTLVPDYPDFEIVLGAGALSGDISGTLRRMLGISDEFFNTMYSDIRGQHAFSMMPILMRPQSRGRLKLRSRNPFHWPRLQPNYFAVRDDLVQMREAVKRTIALAMESAAFAELGTRFHQRKMLGCEQWPTHSDEYYECCARMYTSSLQHQVGTCRMGAKGAAEAVVDERLRVQGVRRLRVVDASVMPVLPAAHTNAVVFMIGEKAADMIAEDWASDVTVEKGLNEV